MRFAIVSDRVASLIAAMRREFAGGARLVEAEGTTKVVSFCLYGASGAGSRLSPSALLFDHKRRQ